MARTVSDAAVLLGALTGVDPKDAATQGSSGKTYTDYTQFLDPNGLRGARLGVARAYFTIGSAVDEVMAQAIDVLRHAGAEILDPVDLATPDAWGDNEMQVLLYEFKADLNAYLAGRNAQVKSLADCIAFNDQHRNEEMPFFQQELMIRAQDKGPLSEKAYKDALAADHRATRKEGIDAILSKQKLDAIIGPTAGPAWVTDWVNGDRADSGCASPAAVAGYPHVTVPAGFIFGLPVGLSFFGTAWSEPKLIKYAFAFEKAHQARKPPQFSPTVNFFG
jgi:amidase